MKKKNSEMENGGTERKPTEKTVTNKQIYPSFPVWCESWQVSLKQE